MAEQDFSEYQGKKVIVKHQDGEQVVEVEGTVEQANALGLLVKPKGKTNLRLLEASDIVEVSYAPEKLKAITVKKLQPIQYGQARQHLADRHGYDLAALAEYPEHEAYEFHKTINHEDPKISHIHVEKSESTEEAAPAEAETAEA